MVITCFNFLEYIRYANVWGFLQHLGRATSAVSSCDANQHPSLSRLSIFILRTWADTNVPFNSSWMYFLKCCVNVSNENNGRNMSCLLWCCVSISPQNNATRASCVVKRAFNPVACCSNPADQDTIRPTPSGSHQTLMSLHVPAYGLKVCFLVQRSTGRTEPSVWGADWLISPPRWEGGVCVARSSALVYPHLEKNANKTKHGKMQVHPKRDNKTFRKHVKHGQMVEHVKWTSK